MKEARLLGDSLRTGTGREDFEKSSWSSPVNQSRGDVSDSVCEGILGAVSTEVSSVSSLVGLSSAFGFMDTELRCLLIKLGLL
jgi:hypothetical protein